MTHLYFKDDFISNNFFKSVITIMRIIKLITKIFLLRKKLGINTIIVDKNKLSEDNNFTCKTEQLKSISEYFSYEKKEVDFCYLKNKNDYKQ